MIQRHLELRPVFLSIRQVIANVKRGKYIDIFPSAYFRELWKKSEYPPVTFLMFCAGAIVIAEKKDLCIGLAFANPFVDRKPVACRILRRKKLCVIISVGDLLAILVEGRIQEERTGLIGIFEPIIN